MATDALKKAYEAQREALKVSTQSQQQQAQSALKSTEAQYNQAYQSTVNQYEKAYQTALSEYEANDVNIQKQAEDVARQAYVQKMEGMKVAPNVLQNAGLAGTGYAESTLAGINNAYKNTWSDVMNTKNESLSENDRLKGLSSAEKQYGISEAEANRQFGLSQAQAQLEQNNFALQGQLSAGLLDIEAQYQTDLANYLASIKQLAASGFGSSSSSKDVSNATSQSIEQGLAQIPFDPRTQNYSALETYLIKYIQAGVITETEAQSMLDRLMSKYQPNAQNTSGSRTVSTPTKTVTPTRITPTKTVASGSSKASTLKFSDR